MAGETERAASEGRGLLTLWMGMLAGPIVWLFTLQINFMLVPWACSNHLRFLILIVVLVALVLVALAGLGARGVWRRIGPEWPGEAGDSVTRARFMAVVGMMMSALFFLVILGQGIATAILQPCE